MCPCKHTYAHIHGVLEQDIYHQKQSILTLVLQPKTHNVLQIDVLNATSLRKERKKEKYVP